MKQLINTIQSFPDNSPTKIFFSIICACKLNGAEVVDANKVYEQVFKNQNKLPYLYYSAMISKSDFFNTLIIFNQYNVVNILEIDENQCHIYISINNDSINSFLKTLKDKYKADIFYLANKTLEATNNNHKDLCL